MDSLVDFASGLLSGRYALDDLVRWGGYVVLVAIVFAETGLLIGFFLPGDSLLITAGLVAATGQLNIWWLNVLLILAAVIGDSVGYSIGWRLGPRLFTREKSLLFNPKHVARTRDFYERHGAKTIVIARFVPIIRTFAPVVAGVARMPYRRFAAFNVWGGIGWVCGMTLFGYSLGRYVPGVMKHVDVVIIAVIAASLVPAVVEYVRHRKVQ